MSSTMLQHAYFLCTLATLVATAHANSLTEALGLKRGVRGAIASHSTGSAGDEPLANISSSVREKRQFFGGGGWGGGLLVSSETPNGFQRSWIVSEHNRYRRMVPATDMRMVYWSDELAASAQRHADTCDFRHSRNRVNIGENIWAAPHYNYQDALSIWYNEVNNPYCACNNGYKHCCGHYIQVVWARTNLVGCGFSRCRDVQGVLGFGHRAVFVCHYNPQGNKVRGSGNGQLYAVPAFTWAQSTNQRCSDCPSDAPGCHEGLCYMPLNHRPASNSTATATNNGDNHNGAGDGGRAAPLPNKGPHKKGQDEKSSALDKNTVEERR